MLSAWNIVTILLLALLFSSDGCNHNWGPTGASQPPPPTPNPTRLPTAHPTLSPTPRPSPSPTVSPTFSPTPMPTPPPPPPPFLGYMPVPPTPVNERTFTSCTKRVEFTIDVGAVRRAQVQETWVYECTYSICSTVDLYAVGTPTTCGCGMSLTMAPGTDGDINTNGPVTKPYDVSIHSARLVVYQSRFYAELAVIPGWEYKPSPATTAMLMNASSVPNSNWAQVVAGFGAVVEPFQPGQIALLDTTVPGNEDNVAALCFTVLQAYRTKTKWPEPAFPALDAPPNVYSTTCVPYKLTPNQQPYIHFRDIYVFSREGSTTGAVVHRYYTAYYLSNNCHPFSGYVTVEREFKSSLTRSRDKPGCFLWHRTYTDNYLIGGVPLGFGLIDTFYSKGWRNVTFRQPYTRFEKQCDFHLESQMYATDCTPSQVPRVGVLYAALLGQKFIGTGNATNPEVPINSSGPQTKVCDSLLPAWSTCMPGSAGSGSASYCGRLDVGTFKGDGTYRWKLPTASMPANNELVTSTKCDIYKMCASDSTYLCFQNWGVSDRDFHKSRTSWMVTGDRDKFCSFANNVDLDELKLIPIREGELDANRTIPNQSYRRRKRHDGPFFESFAEDPIAAGQHDALLPRKRYEGVPPVTYIRKRGVLQESSGFVNDPPPNQVPNQVPGFVHGAVGSTNADFLPGGSHPLQLFPDTFAVPVNMDPADMSCGSYPGDTITVGCGSKQYRGWPPCIEGQLGCTCRTNSRRACDAPYECRGGSPGFCVKPPCQAGLPGCACDNGQCSTEVAGELRCDTTIDRCVYNVAMCPEGRIGCPCIYNATSEDFDICTGNANACVQGVCVPADRTNCVAQSGGCVCGAGGACDRPELECTDLGECMSKARCERGSRGCSCTADKRCQSEMTCHNVTNMCVKPECPKGTPGCECGADCKCSVSGYSCNFVYDDAEDSSPCNTTAETACLSVVSCNKDQSERCLNYCMFPGNVARCPPCEHEVPQCVQKLSAASTLRGGAGFAALLAAIVLLLAMLV